MLGSDQMLELNTPYVDSQLRLSPTGNGVLDTLTFATKDVFAIKGYTTGLGNPLWKKMHHPASQNAVAVQRLLAAGAELTGITISDEFMFSIKGSNCHYGAPRNVKHPDCYTGGSSSGSAAAVAAGDVDFAIGTDTGGSVRVPASYCGLYGFRPTHTQDLLRGVAPLAESFDTVGVLASKATTLEQVGAVLYSGNKLLYPDTIYYLNEPSLTPRNSHYQERVLKVAHFLDISDNKLVPLQLPTTFGLERLHNLFRDIQGRESWKHYGKWIDKYPDSVGPDIMAHFNYAKTIHDNHQLTVKYNTALAFSKWVNALLGTHAILVLPTTSSSAPLKRTEFGMGELIRNATQQLTSIAGLTGNPQVAIPYRIDDQDYSLSVISGANTDQSLLWLAKQIEDGMSEQ